MVFPPLSLSDQQKREGCAAGEGRQQEAAFAPLFNFPGAGFGEGDAGVGAQHGSHPLSSAHKKGAPHPWKIHGRSAPCWCVMKFCAAKMDRLNAVCLSVCLSVCLIIAPAMGLSRKIGGFLMAGASFFGDRSLYYTITPGDAHGSFSVKKRTIAPPASAAKAPASAAAARIIMQNRHKAPGTDENYLFRKTILRQTADLCAASCEKSCSF